MSVKRSESNWHTKGADHGQLRLTQPERLWARGSTKLNCAVARRAQFVRCRGTGNGLTAPSQTTSLPVAVWRQLCWWRCTELAARRPEASTLSTQSVPLRMHSNCASAGCIYALLGMTLASARRSKVRVTVAGRCFLACRRH